MTQPTAYTQAISIETKQYDESNGLSRYANYIHKDTRGVIWIGTQFGLYRFDGRDFITFNERSGLPFRQIMEIYEDSEGWFWLYKSCYHKPNCVKDLAFFHPLTKEVLTFEQRFGNQLNFTANQIQGIGQDKSSIYFTANHHFIIWSAEKGIQQIPIKGLTNTPTLFTKINEEIFGAYTLIQGDIHYLAIDIKGNVSQAPQSISKINLDKINLDKLRKKAFEFSALRFQNIELSFAPNGAIRMESLNHYLPANENIVPFLFDGQLSINREGQFFHLELGQISDRKRIYTDIPKINTRGANAFQNIWVKPKKWTNEAAPYQQRWIGLGGRHILYDKDTQIAWRADRDGITTYHFKNKRFQHIHNINSYRQLAVQTLKIDSNQVLLGFEKTWYSYLVDDQSSRSTQANYKRQKDLRKYLLTYEKGDEFLWGIDKEKIFQIDRKTLTITKNFLYNNIDDHSALIKKDSQLWIAAAQGIFIFNIFKNTIHEFQDYNGFQELGSSKIHFFKETSNGQFWIGSDSGLYLWSLEKGIIARYGAQETGKYYLPADNFFHLSNAKAGGYWLATMNGLIKWEGKNHSSQWQHFTEEEDQLATNEMLSAFEDDYGFVWIATPHGLIQWQIKTQLSKTYTQIDGLSSNNFQEYSQAQMHDGHLIFGSYDGYNIFLPRDFKEVDFNPQSPLVITEFEQFSEETQQLENRLAELLQDTKIVLQPGDRFFHIRVILKDYRAAEKHRFAHKIDGYHQEWQEQKDNLIRVSGLPYGKHLLKIKGRLSDGQYSQSILEIPIEVVKPYYLRTWFFVLIASLLLLLAYLGYSQRTRKFLERQKLLEHAVQQATENIHQKNRQLEKDKQTIESQAEELRQLDQVKSRFFANVSHELRTPLTLMLGPITSMVKSQQLDNKNFTLGTLVKQNAQHLLKLVNEILDLTKLDADKLELKEENISIYSFLQRLLAAFESHAQKQGVQFEFSCQVDKYLQINLDGNKFEKIINNLLSNAFKFTPSGGKIEVIVEDKASHLQVLVRDNGRGIHPDDVPHVFNRFYQSKQADAPVEGGSGIGLSLSMELAKLMEGQLWVESVWGTGSSFFFQFPKKQVFGTHSSSKVAPEKKEVVLAEIEEGSTQASPFSTTILIVEDNHSMRQYLRMVLSEYYEIISAENGKVALGLLNQKPQLIISDIMMPEMDGYQLLQRLKTEECYRHIPVIMLTARAELEDKLKALRVGVDDYMLKPFEEEELLARVRNLLLHAVNRQHQEEEVKEPVIKEVSETASYPINDQDAKWLEDLEQIVLDNLGDFNFSVAELAHTLITNRWKLNNRIKQATGLTPRKYIQEARLNQARQLLESRSVNSVKQVAYEVGMKDIKYFSRQFKLRFGKNPSAYLS